MILNTRPEQRLFRGDTASHELCGSVELTAQHRQWPITDWLARSMGAGRQEPPSHPARAAQCAEFDITNLDKAQT